MVDSNTYFIQWLDANIPNNDSCQILDFSFSLGFDGGNFALLTSNVVGSLSDEITLFTLSGTITRSGKKMSSNAYGPTVKGIFGPPLMNQEFDIIASGNQYYLRFLSNQILRPLLINNNEAPTVWDMARNIATQAGVHLSYHVVDAPYEDSIAQTGLTGKSALASLASQVGGQLRWNGSNYYSIVYPDFSSGTFTVPSPYLLTAEGMEYENILDLGLGVSGTGVIQIPKSNPYGTDTQEVPQPTGNAAVPFTVIQSIRQAVTSDDPPIKIDLPPETTRVLFQTRVAPGQQTSAAVGVTSNDQTWFELPASPLQQSHWKKFIRNGALVAEAYISYNLYPDSLPAIANGNFITDVAVEQLDLSSNFQQSQTDSLRTQKDQINKMLSNLRYIKSYEGTINCFFYGVIPIPGMWASATNICGETVDGIIESVSFNAPGILTINVAKYLRINFLEPGSNINSQPVNLVI